MVEFLDFPMNSLNFHEKTHDLLNVHENFNSNVFLVGNAVLYLFGLSIFMKLLKNYQKRELVNANIQTIILQTLFCVFYIISLNLFFI